MDRIMAGMDFMFVYLDDVIIGSLSMSEDVRTAHVDPLTAAPGGGPGHQ
jgi:hypothetical protein